MKELIFLLIFSMMLVTLIAHPAPVSIEPEDLILILSPCLIAVLCLSVRPQGRLYPAEYHLWLAILLYSGYLFISILSGLLHNVPLLNILRSIGPYINFLPLLAIGLLPAHLLNVRLIAVVLIFIGAVQASYQLYLYFTHAGQVTDTMAVLRGRITLIDPRATLPIVLSTAILPLAFIFPPQTMPTQQNRWLKACLVALVFLGLFGGIVTLTRSIVLAVLFGWLVFFLLFSWFKIRINNFNLIKNFQKIFFYLVLFSCVFLLISLIPKIHLLEQGLLARFTHSASSGVSADYSNGRIYDEWIPALSNWLDSGIFSIVFGMGAGNTFTVVSGEERTYIHNLIIYNLVYGGLYGFLASIGLYVIAFRTLMMRAQETCRPVYIGLATLLASMFFYGQLFAVHKGLAFNAMLFLILALALYRPGDKHVWN